MLLKKAARKGLTPATIAGIMCRETLTKSPLEKLHGHAMELAGNELPGGLGKHASGIPDELYLSKMAEVLDEYLDDLVLEDVGLDDLE